MALKPVVIGAGGHTHGEGQEPETPGFEVGRAGVVQIRGGHPDPADPHLVQRQQRPVVSGELAGELVEISAGEVHLPGPSATEPDPEGREDGRGERVLGETDHLDPMPFRIDVQYGKTELGRIVPAVLFRRAHGEHFGVLGPREGHRGDAVDLHPLPPVVEVMVNVPGEEGLHGVPAQQVEEPGAGRLGDVVVVRRLVGSEDEGRVMEENERKLESGLDS